MASLFKKKSFMLAIISIAVIIATSLGAYIVIAKGNLAKDKKNTSVASDKVAVTQDNSKKSDVPINDNSNSGNSNNEKAAVDKAEASNEKNNEKTTVNKSEAANEKKSNSETPSAPAPKPVQKSVKEQPAKTSKNVNSTTTQVQAKPQTFVSKNLGFTITFPASWTDKYSIVEENNGVRVYFKPKNKAPNGAGLLFKIVKKGPDVDESYLDSIPGSQRYFTAKNTTYVIGGPTDVNFPGDHPEFKTFLKMSRDSSTPLKTLKAIN